MVIVASEDQPRFHFNPEGELWKTNRESILILGGQRAILMQLAHPLVAQGVEHFSGFKTHPLQRLYHTVALTSALVFGTHEETAKAAKTINGMHARVRGSLEGPVGAHADHAPYYAKDPALLQWVWATLVDSALTVKETFVGPISDAQKEAYYQEYKGVLPYLGGKPDLAPKTYKDFTAYLEEMVESGQVAVGDTARNLAPYIFLDNPSLLSAVTLPVSRVLKRVTIGLLPEELRKQYGYTWTEHDQKMLDRAASISRRGITRVPDIFRFSPAYRHARRLIKAA